MKRTLSAIMSIILALTMITPCVTAFADDFSNVAYKISATSYVYSGKEINPIVTLTKTVTDENGNTSKVVLTEDVDYTVSYLNNIKVGIGTVTVSGIGDYEGAKDIVSSFKIKPQRVSTPSVTKTTNSSVSLKWNALPEDCGITGYKVYTCDKNGGNIKYLAKTSKNTITLSNLKLAAKYYFVVRAYKNIKDGSTLAGEYSGVRATCTKPNQVVVNSVTNTKDKKAINVNWGKKNGSGYEVEYSTNKDFKNAKRINISDPSTTSKKIKVNAKKKYYVRVRAYKLFLDTKKNYGAWSVRVSNDYSKTYSSYSSYYVNNANRTKNLKLACKEINGTILAPGETFSFNKTVGKRTEARGFKPAHVFAGSNETVMGVGGGVCQVASTMFNAALLGNFQIVERHQHSQRVSYVPLGRDSAIYWGAQDFKFKNNTDRPVKLVMACKDGKISCTIKVCENVSPKKVNLSVSRSGNHFTLKRTVGGKVNYQTGSTY